MLRLWPLVWTLSLFDIRLRYRGSLLGPFWLTLSTLVMVATIGFLYARLFHQNVSGYLPFLSISLVLWSFISTITAEGSVCFTQAEGTFSSGMVVRLGFALATAIKPQILLMDEWILAGDASFLDKARHRLEMMVRGADILVLSSHSADIILQWCNRVIWMDGGQVKADGTPEEVLSAYLSPEQFALVKANAKAA